MKSKRTVVRRVNILFGLFFLFAAAGIFFSSSSRGFRMGWSDSNSMFGDPEMDIVHSNMLYGLDVAKDYDDFNQPVYSSQDGSVVAYMRPSKIDVKVVADADNSFSRRHLAGVTISAFVCLLAYVAIYVLMFIMLLSLSRSVSKGDLFQRRNIVRVRAIGALLIVGSLSQSLSIWLNARSSQALFAASSYGIDATFHVDYGELITAILILFIGEVFAIGYNLSEEQKLTI